MQLGDPEALQTMSIILSGALPWSDGSAMQLGDPEALALPWSTAV